MTMHFYYVICVNKIRKTLYYYYNKNRLFYIFVG